MAWDYTQLCAQMATRTESTMCLGLERMRAAALARDLLTRRMPPIIHVAGTNGKGSTIAFLTALLRASGANVVAFISPHLIEFRERVQWNGVPVDGDALAQGAEAIWPDAETYALTYFETAFLLALEYVATVEPDYFVVETGLGGRLDATNIVTPACVILTPIGYDHMQWLGNDLAAIAAEKCGIIKSHVPVVSAPQRAVVRDVIVTHAAQQRARVHVASPVLPDVVLGLLGEHQRINAGVAVAVMESLPSQGARTLDVDALAHAHWSGRCEWLSTTPPVLFDGAHNREGAEALAHYLRDIKQNRAIICYLGIMAGKPADAIIDTLGPVVDTFCAVTPPRPKGLLAELLVATVQARGWRASATTLDALGEEIALGATVGQITVVTGSLTLYAQARQVAAMRPSPVHASASVNRR